ncbi:hypothetical protein B6U99_05320 [Candidatus Geothermarchaeota archaeon ex4572_27]|nr:MAG: hypothetical protein B6U99_05320 [Candidatus Geothermarchaeota archaeon ex4572_27]
MTRQLVEEARRIIVEEGGRALEEARREVRRWRILSPRARRAILEFMRRWRDYTRPALMSLSCRAVGGRPEDVVGVAAALILVSGAFDLHDDIIDRSYVRGPRRRKTILGRYGEEVALLIGDALLLRGSWMLARELSRFRLRPSRLREALDLIFELGSAEALELELVGRVDVKVEDYLRLVEMKAADVEAYAKLGALIGGGSDEQVEALGAYGRRLGMITILRDDIEDLLNYKVELRSRVLREVLPLPLIYALSSEARGEVVEILRRGELGDEELERLVELADRSGGVDNTLSLIDRLAEEAERALDRVGGSVEGLRVLVRAAAPRP